MNVVALTLKSFVDNARLIVGDEAIVTSGFDLVEMQTQIDLLLVFLHPSADGHAWLNDAHESVVTDEQLAAAMNLKNAVVFVGACYGLENEAMIMALEHAGAKAIIAGPGVNIGGSEGWLSGADVMAGALRSALQIGLPIGSAWRVARGLAHVAKWRGVIGAEDALGYRLATFGEGNTKRGGIIAGVIGLLLMLFAALSAGGQHAAVQFDSPISPLDTPTVEPATVTPTQTPTPTTTPTITPRATRYVLTAVPFGTATPSATVLCCQTASNASVPIHVYFPHVMANYEHKIQWIWPLYDPTVTP